MLEGEPRGSSLFIFFFHNDLNDFLDLAETIKICSYNFMSAMRILILWLVDWNMIITKQLNDLKTETRGWKVMSDVFMLSCFCFSKRALLKLFWNWKNVFYFTWKTQILEFYNLKFHGVIKCLSMKQEMHFTE